MQGPSAGEVETIFESTQSSRIFSSSCNASSLSKALCRNTIMAFRTQGSSSPHKHPESLFVIEPCSFPFQILPPVGNISKVWAKSGVTRSYGGLFPNRIICCFWTCAAERTEPLFVLGRTAKDHRTPPQVARDHHPNFGAPVDSLPICW